MGLDRRVATRMLAAAFGFGLLLPGAARGEPEGSVLARYTFDDDDQLATGPDTFAIWQAAWHTGRGRGRARLSTAYHRSGFRSLALTDVAGDGDFPELQGYFPARTKGRVHFHFSFLTTGAKDELNVALAGPRHFTVEKDGIAFWLATRDGFLVHHSDRSFRRIAAVESFVWYTVDVDYEVGAGLYSLRVQCEGQEAPLFARSRLRDASGQPGSAVDKFSFVGAPFSDASNVTYYVDDVAVGVDEAVTQKPFAAPGRRQLFLDLFTHYRLLVLERRCLPAGSPSDVGLRDEDLAALRAGDAGGVAAQAHRDWTLGCRALADDEPAQALERFLRAEKGRPDAPLYAVSAVLALARLGRYDEAEARLSRLQPVWGDDPRYAVASAYVGIARRDLTRAEEWLRPLAEAYPERLDDALAAEQYFYVLLWMERLDLARGYAEGMVTRLQSAGRSASSWLERAGDAAFYARDLAVAGEMYARAEKGDPRPSVFLKQADLAYLAGDLARERALREHYYGRLSEE